MGNNEEYVPLTTDENTEKPLDDASISAYTVASNRNRKYTSYLLAITLLLFVSNCIFTGLWISTQRNRETVHPPTEYSTPPSIKTTYKPFLWTTQYSGYNETAQDEYWDSIVWTHGMISRDRKWAESQNWPNDGMDLPSDNSKGVWLLEAYHELHCVQLLREFTKNGLGTQSPSLPQHVSHCFDTLLQGILCHADPTPLRVTGRSVVGNGQLRKCKDWSELSKYATEYSSCYASKGDDVTENFGSCDGGDGLVPMVLQTE